MTADHHDREVWERYFKPWITYTYIPKSIFKILSALKLFFLLKGYGNILFYYFNWKNF
jgi:hypothetical protein